jgi:hypothetical protein
MSALIEAARAALNYIEEPPAKLWPAGTLHRITINLRTALAAAEAQPYTDSTPHLNVGNSSFERWFQEQPFATEYGIKQISRDSYAAGMGDPLVVAAPPAQPAAQPLTDAQIEALVLETVYENDERIPYRDYWVSEIGMPFARAIERAHGIGSQP